MTTDRRYTGSLRHARFVEADLAGASFRNCNLSDVTIASSYLANVRVSGVIDTVLINGIDVTGFVAAELDRRHPERVRVRGMRTADDYRAMWRGIETLWSVTRERAERLPEPVRHERVDEEWSFVETLRHLVFATDLWASHMVLGEPKPYHPLGLPPTDFPPEDRAALGIDAEARPSYAEVMAARADRMARVRAIVATLTDDDLERLSTGALPAAWEEPLQPVGECLRVVMEEEVEHHRYTTRDLAALEARR